MDDSLETRTVIGLSRGARVGVMLALLLLVVAAYLFWSPIQLSPPAGGFPVKCGTAAYPPGDALSQAACGNVNVIRQWQAGGFAVAAVIVALGSGYAFGVRRSAGAPSGGDHGGPVDGRAGT